MYLSDKTIVHNGVRYWFEWESSYQDEIDFKISEASGAPYRASLRRGLPDYARKHLNYDEAGIEKHVVASIGILRQCVGTNHGMIPAATIEAFNAWREREYERQMQTMASQPERYGEIEGLRASFPAPVPVVAGRWTNETGWTRVDVAIEAAATDPETTGEFDMIDFSEGGDGKVYA